MFSQIIIAIKKTAKGAHPIAVFSVYEYLRANLLTFQQEDGIIPLVEISTSGIGGRFMKERFETFTMLINRISRNIRKIKNQEMAEYGLRSAHTSCLYYLYLEKGLTATELCERCEEDKATISRAIEYLELKGYISNESMPSKRYKTPLFLTDSGEALGKKIADKIAAVLIETSDGLNEDERARFYKSLAIVSNCLDSVATKGVTK